MRALLALLLLIPAVTGSIQNPDGDFETTLYMHVNGQQEIQLNPIPPPEDFVQDGQPGGATHSACAPTPGQRLTNQQQHTWYAIVSPQPPKYTATADGVRGPHSLLHRGIQDDLRLTERNITLDWYMRARAVANTDAIAPQVVVEATIREGDDLSVDDMALNAGRIVAATSSAPAHLHPQLAGHPQVSYDAAAGVYHFHLEMEPRAPLAVPKLESFNVRVDVFLDNPYCGSGDEYIMPDLVSVVSLPSHRPRMTLGVANPVTIDRLSAVVDDDLVHLAADARAVFGASDAILSSHAFSIQGPMAAQTTSKTSWGEGQVLDGRVFPAGARDGFQGMEAWAYLADGAHSGLYNATLTLQSESGALATATVPFGLGDDRQTCTVLATGAPSCSLDAKGDHSTPAPLLLLGLVAALALRRR